MQLKFIARAKSPSGRQSIESSSGRAALDNAVPFGSVAGHRLRFALTAKPLIAE
jgi:hypothetical protein